MPSLDQFRKRVLTDSLFSPCGMAEAMKRLGFVQADPIRCPARAQDLILRQRVKNYRAGDLERRYPDLDLEECYLFAYGFLSKDLWQIVHPKTDQKLTDEHRQTLDVIRQHGPMHSRDLESHVGGQRVQNYWGGFSRSAKMAMESLHHRGALRVANRINGVRVYEAADELEPTLSNEERLQEIMLVTLQAMGATTRRFLLSELSHFKYLVANLGDRRRCLQDLIDAGRIRVDTIDEVEYLSLDSGRRGRMKADTVRILAPFDPLVRDRTRFEHFWNWTYRFEAYTPKPKRKLGYYAMPVLWQDQIVGWANATVDAGRLKVDFGYADRRPKDRAFRQAAESEVNQLAKFLGLDESVQEISHG
ncbi:DNA glycosylase AlkZ-like family protein [Rhodopirellula sp. P2]|uniref:DNA glycosylase AlkZ-like family protein n=1 Tax=Rhodopirellula sp. P2 TaxID=2127060 RepID=UPI002367BB77|nr:crosslink repair DNA glycosylase YcaQ family protein [Rhodopirellula sp. P2]WDQ19367.1 crosslink repair DNA glycosylase YcaQ family protein [Rhodopirellula sp. P2]